MIIEFIFDGDTEGKKQVYRRPNIHRIGFLVRNRLENVTKTI